MTHLPKSRPHLAERAMEALGGGLSLRKSPAPTAPPGPAIDSAEGPAPNLAPPPSYAPATGFNRAFRPVPTLPNEPTSSRAAAPPILAKTPAGLPGAAPVINLAMLKRAGLAVGVAGPSRSRLSEEIGIVQTQLLRTAHGAALAEGRCNRIILITSARPGEGKTFTAVNIAASLAASGSAPVLLIDTDGKHGAVSELLDVHKLPGIRLLTADEQQPVPPLCLSTAQPRLSVLSYGGPAPRPGQPDQPPAPMVAAAIMRAAAALPDHIIIVDSAPCLSTSDPSSFAPIAGQVVVVVQAERTQKNEVEAALDIVDSCPILQLLLNRTQLTSNDTFGAYGDYLGYGARPAE